VSSAPCATSSPPSRTTTSRSSPSPPTFSLKAWSQAENYQFPLLSDFWPHGETAKAYGVFNETAGMAVRGTFLVDKEGVVRFAEVNQPGEARDQEGWKKALASL